MKKLTVLCDMDGIIVNLTQKWLNLYNKDHNDNLTIADIKEWELSKSVKKGVKVNDYLYSPNFFLDVDAIEGALEGMKAIQKMGHHLVILSAPSWPGNSASDKITWMRKHAPFVNKRDIILGHNKYLVKGDVLIDDSPTNIQAYRAHWPQSTIMTIAYPFNETVRQLCDVFAQSFKDTKAAWEQITSEVERRADEH